MYHAVSLELLKLIEAVMSICSTSREKHTIPNMKPHVEYNVVNSQRSSQWQKNEPIIKTRDHKEIPRSSHQARRTTASAGFLSKYKVIAKGGHNASVVSFFNLVSHQSERLTGRERCEC